PIANTWVRPSVEPTPIASPEGQVPARSCQPDQLVDPAAASVATYLSELGELPIANTWVRPSVEPTPIASPEGQVPARSCQPDQLVDPAAASVATYMSELGELPIANTWVRPSVEPTPIASPEGQVPARSCQPDQLVDPAAASVATYMSELGELPIANTWVRPSVEPTPIASPEGQVPPRSCQPDQLVE